MQRKIICRINSRNDIDSCTVKIIGLLGGIVTFVIKTGISIAIDCVTNSNNQKRTSKITGLEATKRSLQGGFMGFFLHKYDIYDIDDLTKQIKTK